MFAGEAITLDPLTDDKVLSGAQENVLAPLAISSIVLSAQIKGLLGVIVIFKNPLTTICVVSVLLHPLTGLVKLYVIVWMPIPATAGSNRPPATPFPE